MYPSNPSVTVLKTLKITRSLSMLVTIGLVFEYNILPIVKEKNLLDKESEHLH